jgi:CTP-dependent riboflavin kinase
VVFPEVAGYPADKFEVISAVPVRQALGVADGDRVAVSLLC